jgi:hypothetical protein
LQKIIQMKEHSPKTEVESVQPVASAKDAGATFLVPECDSSPELICFVDELEECLAKKPPQLTLKFVGIQRMDSDPVLLIYDTLLKKDETTQLITDARSPIVGNGVLLWLAGDVRLIRPTAWLRFENPKAGRQRRRHHPWDDRHEWWQEEEDSGVPEESRNPNPQTILKLMNRYLPVQILVGRLLTPHVLDEFCLLGVKA